MFSGKAEALTKTEAGVTKIGLVPGVLVENLDMVVVTFFNDGDWRYVFS